MLAVTNPSTDLPSAECRKPLHQSLPLAMVCGVLNSLEHPQSSDGRMHLGRTKDSLLNQVQ